ncbi:MAG TPA: hypothetical protein DCL63_12755 [Firmicutes bacterium]|nr:hypothetical protein [Bacillota bacterium]
MFAQARVCLLALITTNGKFAFSGRESCMYGKLTSGFPFGCQKLFRCFQRQIGSDPRGSECLGSDGVGKLGLGNGHGHPRAEPCSSTYKMVANDRRWGIHNCQYTKLLLEDSIGEAIKEELGQQGMRF